MKREMLRSRHKGFLVLAYRWRRVLLRMGASPHGRRSQSLQAEVPWEGGSSLVSRGRREPMSWAGQAAQEAVEAPPHEASPGLPDIQPPRQAPKQATRPGCSEPVCLAYPHSFHSRKYHSKGPS